MRHDKPSILRVFKLSKLQIKLQIRQKLYMRELLGATGFGVGGESLRVADKANSVKFISFINIPTAPANYIIYQNPNNTRLKITILYIFYY